MPERLSRWHWAREHTELSWPREIAALLIGGGLYVAASEHFGWDETMSPVIGGVLIACLTALLVYGAEFGWRFAKARVIQDRKELGAYRAKAATTPDKADVPLDLDVVPFGLRREGLAIWVYGIRITNRSHSSYVSLDFVLDIKFDTWTNRLQASAREDDAQLASLPTPLAIPPEHTKTGNLAFPSPAPDWLGDLSKWPTGTYLLTATDHVSGKSVTVRAG